MALLAAATVLATSAAATAGPLDACFDAAEEGQSLRQKQSLVRARAELAECTKSDCPPAVQADCTRWAAEIDEAIPTIVVRARSGEGQDVPEARARVDGASFPVDGAAHELDPGRHEVAVSAPGFVAQSVSFVAVEREKARIVDVVLRPLESPTPTPRDRDASGPSVVGLGLGGVAIAALGLGTVSAVDALSYRGDLRDRCGNAGTCTGSEVDDARGKLVRTDVLLGVGLVAALASTYFLFLRPPRARAE